MIYLLSSLFLILGFVIGSFLNVVVSRYHTSRSLGGRSACMSCQNKLRWYELIPLFSFVALRGRCRTCSTRISMHYPVVEFSTGLIFLGVFLKFQDLFFNNLNLFIITFIYYAVVFSLLVMIASYDIKHKIIPDELSLFFGLLTFVGLFFFSDFVFDLHLPSILQFCSGLVVSIPFALFWLVSGGTWMGLGDAKLAVGLGWLLGISSVLSAMVLSFWIGAIVGVMLIIFSRGHGMKTEIPFAPFLVLGTIISFILNLHIFSVF